MVSAFHLKKRITKVGYSASMGLGVHGVANTITKVPHAGRFSRCHFFILICSFVFTAPAQMHALVHILYVSTSPCRPICHSKLSAIQDEALPTSLIVHSFGPMRIDPH